MARAGSETPIVSVTMPVLNPHPLRFREAVRSVLAQTIGGLELIIVEDPSPARAGDLLAEFTDPRIRHHCNPERTSLIRQRNQALALARAPWVAILDADDVCEPSRPEKQLAYLECHPHVDVLGSQLTIIDEHGAELGYRSYPLEHAAIARRMRRANPIANSAAIFRTTLIREAGGYQYDRHPGVEDFEIWSRLLTNGAVFANHPEPLVRYRFHTGQLKSQHLRGQLLGTLDIKARYWKRSFGCADRVRFWAERFLLWLPPAVVLRAFQAVQYSRGSCVSRQSKAEFRDGSAVTWILGASKGFSRWASPRWDRESAFPDDRRRPR